MTVKDQAIIGVMAIVTILIVYAFALSRALARKPIVATDQKTSFAALEKEVIPLLNNLELNGQLPVVINPEEIGKDNPFAP